MNMADMMNTVNTANTTNTVNTANTMNTVNAVNTANTTNTVNMVNTMNTVNMANTTNTVNMANTMNTVNMTNTTNTVNMANTMNTVNTANTINTQKLKLSYGEKVIVPEMNITINKPEIITIIGPNGSGKSTLLKGIARLLKPAAGHVLLNGKDIHQLPSKEVAQTMAVLPQTVSSPGDMTVLDLIACGRSPHRGLFKSLSKKDRQVIDEAVSLTIMEKFINRRLDTLSGGERQRAWLAMALAQQPKILLLDEPTSYLDIRHQLELMKLIKELYQRMNITIIMVLHDLNHAARYSHRIIAMKSGSVYRDGTVEDVFTAETLKFLYEVEAVVMSIEQKGDSHLVCFTHDISGECRAG